MNAPDTSLELSPTLKRPQDEAEVDDPSASSKRIKTGQEETTEVDVPEAQPSGEEPQG
ncbi:hypothetical protein CERSUDRAFT_81904, partial [Gelatoporia subvermispora B]